jgi:glycosyltransferase involved in cell wall biosynthesis
MTDSIDGVIVHRLWTWQPQNEDPGMVRRLLYYLIFGVYAAVWLLWNVRQYDIVVTSTPPISTGSPGLLAAMLGKPWIVDVRDLWIDASVSLGYLQEDGIVERMSRWFQGLVLHAADRITVTTEGIGDSLQETYGNSLGTKVSIIPNGVDTDRFRPEQTTETDTTLRSEDPTESSPTGQSPSTIIYTGNLGSAQDLESCIRAMNHLSDEDAVLKLVGTGDRESSLKELTRGLELTDRVEFAGVVPRDDVPPLLTEATVGVAPLEGSEELAYAMPTKLYEYLACGLPSVVTGKGEIERFIADSGGGVHAENDPKRIAERIDELLADEQHRRQIARRGRAYVTPQFDRGAIAEQFAEELSQLGGRQRSA